MGLDEYIEKLFERADNHIYSSRAEDIGKMESDEHLRFAAELYNDIIIKYPINSGAFVGKAVALNDLERYEEALEHVQEAIENDIINPLAHIVRAQIYVNLGMYSNAIQDFTNGIALKPGFKEIEYTAINNRGNAYELMDKLDESIKDFTAAIEFDRMRAAGYLNRANIHNIRGEHSKAYDDLTLARNIDPNNILVVANLGDTMISLGIEMENQGSEVLATNNFKEAEIYYGSVIEFMENRPVDKRIDKHYFAAIRAVNGLGFMGIQTQTDYAGMAVNDGILTADKIKKSTKQVFLN